MLKENYSLAKSEAQNSFGDNRLLIEKYIHNSRHIEIQILSDNFGNTISLNERECSIQRRNQKIIEEAPSTYVDNQLRALMSAQAISLAKSVDYKSAGTVEFLVDEFQGFYFLEMNTRLQVEHPVTEYITGFDIVREMINIAKGEPLRITQNQVPMLGWAIESRIYAEDPVNFLPSIGRITQQVLPDIDGNILRFDCGFTLGSEITIHYDPLLLKLISFGKNREEAISNLIFALDQYILLGVKTNIPFIYSVLTCSQFIRGKTHTNFIPDEYPGGFTGLKLSESDQHAIKMCAFFIFINRNTSFDVIPHSKIFPFPTSEIKLWNVIISGDHLENSTVIESVSETNYIIKDSFIKVSDVQLIWKFYDPSLNLRIGPNVWNFQFLNCNHDYITIGFKGDIHQFEVQTVNEYASSQYIKPRTEDSNSSFLTAPMSGRIHDILVDKGDDVIKGSSLLIIEAMKMHNVLISPNEGSIKEINFRIGDNVVDGDCLLEFVN
ncbi:Propionyl-CoA carboxylase alpha chain, mitochondrial isoform X2 [Oopsacas minuta]|uniref:Propionyl-CoA carboxylase alpha chain, mitochondrial isoform X2 n=1 Tax=Oopsacas minuta TaxID=111878 RepID=A0AAV7K9U7_9METZ|nr:Propionyl-CoA carboxylase alpha chain, mitochondrial isoform X2 [Oopsacas minuta]